MNSKLCTQYLSKQQRYFKDFEILNSEEDEVKLSQYELFEYKTYDLCGDFQHGYLSSQKISLKWIELWN